MALPEFSMRQLLEAGVHFGHQTHRWNPRVEKYLFGSRNNIHIIDLSQTVPLLHQALKAVSDSVSKGGRILFVGTKRQASEIIATSSKSCAQYYVNARWLGGTLTNWTTISNSIKRLRELEEMLAGDKAMSFTKKERLTRTRELQKLERSLGGIKDMGGLPDMLFVVDTNKESIAIQEANRLGIPVIAILDSNCSPDGVDYPIPGNDDAGRAISLYCDLIARASIDGISRGQGSSGMDVGESETIAEPALVDAPVAAVEAVAEVKTEAEPAKEEAKAAPEKKAKAAPKKKAKAKSDDTSASLFAAPDGDADDLKKISGVGPVLEKKLNDLGITKFAQVAAFTAEDIAKVDDALSFKGRIERDDWLTQAAALAAE
ncbi:MAG: 30S ribosomal protein S2 [Hyphomicrobiales bacterium]